MYVIYTVNIIYIHLVGKLNSYLAHPGFGRTAHLAEAPCVAPSIPVNSTSPNK